MDMGITHDDMGEVSMNRGRNSYSGTFSSWSAVGWDEIQPQSQNWLAPVTSRGV